MVCQGDCTFENNNGSDLLKMDVMKMKIIDQLFKGLLMFVLPALITFGVWIVLEPATFWQTLTTLIVGVVAYVISFFGVCLVLDEMI